MADLEIEIDGRKLTATPEQTVMQVADAAGIYIPRFCYHKHLSIAANCRMCIVEVEKSPKPLPACATPVMPGMKVFTKSEKTIAAQRAVMEFLLINHPLDCPICDQGGECELQDLAMGYGSSASRYDECKRSIADENLGPLIATDMTRCIYCTRCVRFGAEVAGMREMGGTYRGEDTEIGTFVKHAIQSEVSGNIIDLCPVGALTSKPFRFKARAWELDQAPSIAPHDCMGSNINVHTRYGKVLRVVARENSLINQTWLSDRDRFSYAGIYHADRLEVPMMKIDGEWMAIEWERAFEVVVEKLHAIINEFGADKIGALASPNATLEELYLLQKVVRALGSPHIDHRLRERDMRDQENFATFPGLNMSFAELEQADAIVLIGSNLQKEQPLAALRVRQAVNKGAKVLVINPVDYDFNFAVSAKSIVPPHEMPKQIATFSQYLGNKKKVCILLGALAMHHPQAALLRQEAQQLAATCNATVGFLTDGANSAGAWLAGAIPHRHAGGLAFNHPGLNAYEMLEKPRKAYLLLNVEPDKDFANTALAMAAMQQAEFILAFTMYRNPVLEHHADLILPIAAFTETAGTFVNASGEWQSFNGVTSPYGSSRPAWKILRVLGNFFHLSGFGYESAEEIRHEIKMLVAKAPTFAGSTQKLEKQTFNKDVITRIGEIPIYALDALVRRSQPLQVAQTITEGEVAVVRLNQETANLLHLENGAMASVSQEGHTVELPVLIDERIPTRAAWIAGGIDATKNLGDLFGEVKIQVKNAR